MHDGQGVEPGRDVGAVFILGASLAGKAFRDLREVLVRVGVGSEVADLGSGVVSDADADFARSNPF